MLHPPWFYYVKKPKRFVISSSDKSSERNLSSFFDIKKPRRIEHLQSEEPFSSDPYFNTQILYKSLKIQDWVFIRLDLELLVPFHTFLWQSRGQTEFDFFLHQI